MTQILRAALYMAAGPLLLFWVPIPAVAGLIGGFAGGRALRRRGRAFEVGIVVALLLAVPGLIFGRDLFAALPLVSSALATLMVLWYLLNCAAIPVGAFLGAGAAVRRRSDEAAEPDGPSEADASAPSARASTWRSTVDAALEAIEGRRVAGEGSDGRPVAEQAGEAIRSLIEAASEQQARQGASGTTEPAETDSEADDPSARRRGRGRRGGRRAIGLDRVVGELTRQSRRRGRQRGRDSEPRPAAGGRPVTILFTDIEGSTALTQQLGDNRAQQLLNEHDRVVRGALARFDGREVKHTGDGIMASFLSASAGVEAALAMQAAFAERESARGEETAPLRTRIGLNVGEPVAQGDDLFGSAVQLARRICDEAEPGQILVSDVVRQLCAGKTFVFTDIGRIPLKGFEEAFALYDVRTSS